MNAKKRAGLIVSTIVCFIAFVMIGPMDFFTHGFFYDEIDCRQIAKEDFRGTVSLEDSVYEMVFSPQKPHMTGFEIYLVHQSETGTLHLTVTNHSGKEIDHINVDLSKVQTGSWYKVYVTANLKEGEEYTLRFSAEGYTDAPCLQSVDSAYLPDETVSGNVLLVYAYAKSTFTFQNKVIIALFLMAAWGFVFSLCREGKQKNYISTITAGVFMAAVLTWNYMYNSMDLQNTGFSTFQADSETLVTGVIYGEQDGVYFKNADEFGFGLGRYYDLKGGLTGYGLRYISDDNWLDGYSKTQPAIVVNSNIYSRETAAAGNQIAFDNGEVFRIANTEVSGSNIVLYLDTDHILTSAKYGSLDDVIFYDQNNRQLEKSRVTAYKSQYGLQGKVFRHFARHLDTEQAITNLNLLCSIATAMVFVVIIMLIAAKYNKVLAGCFFITFWLSPWIVNFARNLYWVEYTWFLPMAAGLFCAWKIDNRKCRIISYICTFIAVFGKCLCGYEYISAVMMGLIAFLLVDFALAFIKKDKKRAALIFRTIWILGIIAIAGFMAAICVHAPLKGGGSIIKGIKIIFEQDVLRRTRGADLNEFDPGYWPSFNASVWEVYCRYFRFSTEVITGIPGNLFPLLCVAPLCIFGYEYKMKRLNTELAVMYAVFFFTSVSWFILAKAHSYVHTHMNYVLWYMGFVQICFYSIVNKAAGMFRGLRPEEQGVDGNEISDI